uniref:Uncharacterized protein n=1 Tax=Setaria italica TaxID=4555 RepID=K4APC6_SETIT
MLAGLPRAQLPHLHLPPPITPQPRLLAHAIWGDDDEVGAPELARLGFVGAEAHGAAAGLRQHPAAT